MATIENGSSKTKGREAAEAMYERLFACASAIVATGQEHAPLLVTELEGYAQPVVVPVHDLPTKNHVAMVHREASRMEGVTGCALVMEAFMYAGTDERIAQALMRGELAVADLPEKAECIMFNIRTHGEQYIAFCKIDRATNSLERGQLFDPTGQNNPEGSDFRSASGRFVGDGDTKAQEARRRAN